jgi:hypothetical protein
MGGRVAAGTFGLMICWWLFLLVVTLLLVNNLLNLWENRPFHGHGS